MSNRPTTVETPVPTPGQVLIVDPDDVPPRFNAEEILARFQTGVEEDEAEEERAFLALLRCEIDSTDCCSPERSHPRGDRRALERFPALVSW